ncbi:5-formyltetrahydrofolate cyclo-ligase [Methylocystis echinoides]|uniref:5-formyltetrahydrofolate cyclo-ligase n=1 Tax=Methylocystis echinoides TaxID=29468 RepID=A0A9W6GU91_9HYPH|nr:5-formyltetrahydrofolate cyclo-ligase [Methylocystis echinoides]GLI93152.1 5-formyltetrahydrofolate cyclo-ligase [Methylocystis echinoides]
MTDPKTDLRRHALARRDLVTPQEAHDAAAAIARNGRALVAELTEKSGLTAPVVSVYWPIRSELNTRPLIEALTAQGFLVTLPVMHKVRHPLIFRDFTPGDDLVKGPYGLSEPAEDRTARDPDILFSPLAAFDRRGFRLGYGGGIYDATLSQLRAKKAIVAIGVAYACQEADHVPTEPHDQRLDYLMTERETIIPA